MHYAVLTASSQMIKILLLYNVDIDLQDNVSLLISFEQPIYHSSYILYLRSI